MSADPCDCLSAPHIQKVRHSDGLSAVRVTASHAEINYSIPSLVCSWPRILRRWSFRRDAVYFGIYQSLKGTRCVHLAPWSWRQHGAQKSWFLRTRGSSVSTGGISHHVVRLEGGSRSSSLLHIVQTGSGATRPPVGSCSGLRSQPVITSDHCHWTRHHIPERRQSNCSSILLLLFLLQ
jgi:hypothetical protein